MHPLSTNPCNESHSRKKGRKKLGYRFARYPCLLLSFPEILPISLSFRILYHSSNIVSILTHLPFPRSQLSNGQSSNSPPTIFSDTFLFLDTWTTLSSLHHCSFSSIAHSLFLPPPLSSFPRFYSSLSLKHTNIFDILSLSLFLSLFPSRPLRFARPSALDSRLGNKFSRADTEQYFLAVCTRQFLFLPGAPGTRG